MTNQKDQPIKESTDDLHNILKLKNYPDTIDEYELEKHAILDVLYDHNAWTRSYIKNPFPYLSKNYLSLEKQD